MSGAVRSFIAVDIPDALKHSIGDFLISLGKEIADIKWIEPTNLHFTLRFLGNVEPERLKALGLKLSEALRMQENFSIRLSKIGAFPDLKNPKVLWIGVAKGVESLSNLASKVEDEVCSSGFGKSEKPFSAHLTIGRVKEAFKLRNFFERPDICGFQYIDAMVVDHVTVYKSTLTSRGSVYEALEKIAFA